MPRTFAAAKLQSPTANLATLSQVQRIDAQLDRLQLLPQDSPFQPPIQNESADDLQSSSLVAEYKLETPRVLELQAIVKALSTASSSRPLLPAWRLQELLQKAKMSSQETSASEEDDHDVS